MQILKVPAAEVRSYRDQVKHLTHILYWDTQAILKGKGLDNKAVIKVFTDYDAKLKSLSHDQMIAELEKSFDEAINYFKSVEETDLDRTFTYFFNKAKPTRTIRTISMTVRDHVTHQNALLALYLRMNGITLLDYLQF